MLPVNQGVLVVIPALNEQGSVADVVREVRTTLPAARYLVVDDGSSDATAEVAREAGAEILRLPFNLGVGGAMRAGYRFARDNGIGIVVQVDADGQHEPAAIPDLVEGLRDADLMIGARFAGVGAYDAGWLRRAAMWFLSVLIRPVVRVKLTDVTSGFKAAGPRAVELYADNFPAEYLGDTIEALVIGGRARLRIQQIPVAMRDRQAGKPSHNPLKSAVYLFRACAAFGLAMLRPRVKLEEVS